MAGYLDDAASGQRHGEIPTVVESAAADSLPLGMTASDPALTYRSGSFALNSYRESQVLTASREQLVVLTYDGILRFLGRACRGLESGDYHEKHLGMTRAQALIVDLARSLDRSASPELADGLAKIYAYWLDELATADAGDDQPRIRAIMALVADLREAWAKAARGASG